MPRATSPAGGAAPVTAPETAPPEAPALQTLAGSLPPARAAAVGAAELEPAGEPDAADAFPVQGWSRYEFIRLLGRGGMGAVYLARDRSLQRLVALKFVRGNTPVPTLRFTQEARAQARLSHENICKVYEVGTIQGKAYIAMEYVAGETLDRAAQQMTQPRKLQLIRQIALGLHEAHKMGVLHRDIKPANILVETLEDGSLRPVIMDFGLARQSGDDANLTQTGAVLGTPSYLPPEQARGEVRGLDRRSDVYSLGATLYELLSGRPPFEGDSVVTLLLEVIHKDPPPLRALVPSLPADVETMVMKCLRKEPVQRYDSALAFAADLGRYIRGEPILARRPSLAYRIDRFARRHRALVGLSAVFTVACAALLGSFVRIRLQARTQLELTQVFSEEAREMEAIMQRAHMMPLHDVRRERALVQQRLRQIEAQFAARGAIASVPAHYALGRGYLAVYDHEQAQAHLLLAQRGTLVPPGVDYALGRVYGELYRRERFRAELISDAHMQAAQLKELDRTHLDPARRHLAAYVRTTTGDTGEHLYAEGLLAYYQKDYALALHKAQQSFSLLPWLHEARRLQGDVYTDQGKAQIARGRFDAALPLLQQGSESYAQAAELGRSDPAVHLGRATQQLEELGATALGLGRPPDAGFTELLSASQRALRADPDLGAVYARLLQGYGYMLQYQEVRGLAGDVLTQAMAQGQQAMQRFPQDPDIHILAGYIYGLKGSIETRQSKDPRPALREAIRILKEGGRLRALAPSGSALSEHMRMGLCYTKLGDYASEHGDDPSADWAESARQYALELSSGGHDDDIYGVILHGFKRNARYQLSVGKDPIETIRKMNALLDDIGRNKPQIQVQRQQVTSAGLSLLRALMRGEDEAPAVAAALQVAGAAERAPGERWDLAWEVAWLYGLVAQAGLKKEQDPRPLLDKARALLVKSAAGMAPVVDPHRERVTIELLTARWAMRSGDAGTVDRALRDAAAAAAQALQRKPTSAEILRGAATVSLVRAEWAAQQGRAAVPEVAQGLALIDKALAENPRDAEGLAVRGALYLMKAREARDAGRHEAAAQARAALSQGLLRNPYLKPVYAPQLAAAEQLLAQAQDAVAPPLR